MNGTVDNKGNADDIQACPFCGKTMPSDLTKCRGCGFDSGSWISKVDPSPEEEQKSESNVRTIRVLSAVLVILFVAVVLRFLKVF